MAINIVIVIVLVIELHVFDVRENSLSSLSSIRGGPRLGNRNAKKKAYVTRERGSEIWSWCLLSYTPMLRLVLMLVLVLE